jgi:glycosyltransferase involved in cell wall biosynthesis
MVLYNEPRNHSGIRANRFYESLAAAAPVITPDFPEWRASVESIGCGLSVDPTDPRAIADALQFLLSHPEEAAAMGKRGRHAFLKTFKWTREKEKLLELYDELLNEGLPISGVTAT